MKRLIFLVLYFTIAYSAYFCRSKCSSNSFSGCHNSGPTSCTNCYSTYFTNCATIRTGMTLIEDTTVTTMASVWNVSTVNSALTCSYTSPYGTTFSYAFYNTLLGGDYISRTVPINTPHYRVSIRFSIAFVGVWSANNDFLTFYTNDTIQTRSENLSYTCALTTAATDRICTHVLHTGTTNAFNGVDCL